MSKKVSPQQRQSPKKEEQSLKKMSSFARRDSNSPKKEEPKPQKEEKRFVATKKDQASSCYRLSRAPQKFNSNKAVQSEKNESWIANYYAKNKDAVMDKSVPVEKLQNIANQIAENETMEYKEKLTLLIQNKTLNYIVYGEFSFEAMNAHYQLGYHYHHNGNHASALRHLNKAQQLQTNEDVHQRIIDDTTGLENNLKIETAESYYDLTAGMLAKNDNDYKKRKEAGSNLSIAYSTISNVNMATIDDYFTQYRVEVLKARILNKQKKYNDAKPLYDNAVRYLSAENGDEPSELVADLLCEEANNSELIVNGLSSVDAILKGRDEKELILQFYSRAYEIYGQLGLFDKQAGIASKLKSAPYKNDVPLESASNEDSHAIEDSGAENEPAKPTGDSYAPITTDDENKFKHDEPEKFDSEKLETEPEKEAPLKPSLILGGALTKSNEKISPKPNSEQSYKEEPKQDERFEEEEKEKFDNDKFTEEKQEEYQPDETKTDDTKTDEGFHDDDFGFETKDEPEDDLEEKDHLNDSFDANDKTENFEDTFEATDKAQTFDDTFEATVKDDNEQNSFEDEGFGDEDHEADNDDAGNADPPKDEEIDDDNFFNDDEI